MPVPSRVYRNTGKAAFAAFLSLLIFSACEREPVSRPEVELLQVPSHFPGMTFPSDNGLTAKRWKLGKRLFFDPVLSRDSTISCATCHRLEYALADHLPVSPGTDGRLGARNTPGLFNIGYEPYYTREGGVPTLEMQILIPIQEHAEMDFNIVDASERLMNQTSYVAESHEAYGRDPDPFVITRAIATFERTMISGGSAYDDYLNGNSSALTTAEQRGMNLFLSSSTGCAHCHSGVLFTNHTFENNGLYDDYPDIGRMRLTNDSSDLALFKVPGLRNVEYTAPYMHDGSIATLREVVEHYNSGGADHPNKSDEVRPLNLSPQQIDDLVAFLKSLSDPSVLSDPRFAE